jgi:hypothetical protein
MDDDFRVTSELYRLFPARRQEPGVQADLAEAFDVARRAAP